MSLFRCGGGVNNTPVQPTLIGQYAINNTSVVTRTLTESIAGYKYLWFSMNPITSNTVWIAATAGHTGYGFADVDYFRNNTVTLLYTSGTSGQSTNQTVLLSYVDDTTFTSKASVNSGRTLYVYGIKDMPHGRWNETVLWRNSAPLSNFGTQTIALSDDIDEYDLIKATYIVSTSVATEYSVISEVNVFKLATADAPSFRLIGAAHTAASTNYYRIFRYNGSSSIIIDDAKNQSGSTGNSYVIPLAIIGIKV